MKKLVLLTSLALAAWIPEALAVVPCPSLTAMQCVWTFRGDYVVKGFESTDPSILGGQSPRGELCVDVLQALEAIDCRMGGDFPTSNALGDTYWLGSGISRR
jgi:hypothetical protein